MSIRATARVPIGEVIETVAIVREANRAGVDDYRGVERVHDRIVANPRERAALPGIGADKQSQAALAQGLANYAASDGLPADRVAHRRRKATIQETLRDTVTLVMLMAEEPLDVRQIHRLTETYGKALNERRLGMTLRKFLRSDKLFFEDGDGRWEVDPLRMGQTSAMVNLLVALKTHQAFADLGRDFFALNAKPGVRWGAAHHNAKLDSLDVAVIRRLWYHATDKRGMQKELAKSWGVSQSTISSIVHRKTWKRLTT